jgi:hypothetical protein
MGFLDKVMNFFTEDILGQENREDGANVIRGTYDDVSKDIRGIFDEAGKQQLNDPNLQSIMSQMVGLPGQIQSTSQRLRQDLLRTSRSAASSAVVSAAQAARRAGLTRGSRGVAASQAAAQAAGTANAGIAQAQASGASASMAALPSALQLAGNYLNQNSSSNRQLMLAQLLASLGGATISSVGSQQAAFNNEGLLGSFTGSLANVGQAVSGMGSA